MQRIYGFYNKNEVLKNAHFPDEGHDYSHSKRFPMYEFMAQYLGLNLKSIQNKKGEIDESFITIEDEKALLSFGKHGELLPENAIKNMKELEKIIKKYQK